MIDNVQLNNIQFSEKRCLENSSALLSKVDGRHLSALISFLNLWAKLQHHPATNYSAFEVLTVLG